METILVDSSVWVDFFRSRTTLHSEALDELLAQEMVCTTRVIMAEIIPGAGTPKRFRELKEYFSALPLLEEPASLWEEMMNIQFHLSKKGMGGMSIPDLMIAVIAHAHRVPVFTKDKHFKWIGSVLPVSLYQITS